MTLLRNPKFSTILSFESGHSKQRRVIMSKNEKQDFYQAKTEDLALQLKQKKESIPLNEKKVKPKKQ